MQHKPKASPIHWSAGILCKFAQTSVLAVFPVISHAEIVEYSYPAIPLSEGEAVFLQSGHPWFGPGEFPGSLRMVPSADGNWSLRLDVPGEIDLGATAIARDSSPGRIADVSNGRRLSGAPVGAVLEGPGTGAWPVAVTVVTDLPINELIARAEGGPPWEQVCPEPAAKVDGAWEFRFAVPRESVAWRGGLRIEMEGTAWPEGGALRLGATQALWIRHGQAFHYSPAAVPPSPPRQEGFTIVPSDRLLPGRRIRVLLPRGYDENGDRRYPVLYAEDGQNAFSPGGSFGSWDLDLIAMDLIARGEIPEVIVVAIDNSPARRREYMPAHVPNLGGAAGDYLAMLRDEAIPEIDRRFRILPGGKHRAHLGSSLGGILGWHAAAEFPGLFGTVVAMSPSFLLDREGCAAQAATVRASGVRLWIDSGTEGASRDGYEATMAIRDALLDAGWSLGRDFLHQTGPGQGHNEAAWRSRLPDALRWAYANPSSAE